MQSVPVRMWSLAEANAALDDVRQLLADARLARSALLDVLAHIEDLRIVWGDRIQDPECEDHQDWLARLADFQSKKQALDDAIEAFENRGIALKDLDAGLVDFWAMRGDEPVFLCWKEGEDRVETWHPLNGGFAGRQPVPDLDV